MATTIKLKNSVTATNAPSSLVQGEVAINVTDKKVWVGNAATTPIQLLGGGADGSFTNISVSGVASFADGTVSLPSITNIGDTNTGIFFPAADTIAFTEGGVESMRIDSAGLVGIGTTSPNSRVTIGSNATDAVLSGTTNTTGLNLYARAFGISQIDSVTSSSNNTGMSLRTYNNGTYTEFIANDQGNTTRFQTAGSERMRIDSSGNVGIGTSSPAAKLDIRGSSPELYVAQDGSNNGVSLAWENSNAFAKINTIGAAWPILFLQNGTERMRITSGGDLLVNTTATGSYTDGKIVAIASGTSPALTVKNLSSSQFVASFWNNGTTGDNIIQQFITEASPTVRGSITYNRTAGLTAYNTTSDYRAKDIISLVLNSGELIDSVPVYMGKMKGATQSRPMFIAHETPDYAHTGEKDAIDKDGNPIYQQMDASSLVPVLWAEIQSLRKRVATLESK